MPSGSIVALENILVPLVLLTIFLDWWLLLGVEKASTNEDKERTNSIRLPDHDPFHFEFTIFLPFVSLKVKEQVG